MIGIDPGDFTPEAIQKIAPACAYCGKPAELVNGTVTYPSRPDLAGGWYWFCLADRAWVGVHPGTFKPLGRLADSELRRAKRDAHAAFDPLWMKRLELDKREGKGTTRNKARGRGYKWLAEQLGVDAKNCHIGHMDVAQCRRVVEVCTRRNG